MRVTDGWEGRIVGHVQVQVASRVYNVPVQAAPLEETGMKPGFFTEGTHKFRIVVDSATSEAGQREVIERAVVEAAAFFSKKHLN
jgi:hypothetical protein